MVFLFLLWCSYFSGMINFWYVSLHNLYSAGFSMIKNVWHLFWRDQGSVSQITHMLWVFFPFLQVFVLSSKSTHRRSGILPGMRQRFNTNIRWEINQNWIHVLGCISLRNFVAGRFFLLCHILYYIHSPYSSKAS